MQQYAEFRRLHDRRVAHDKRWDQRSVHFVQRVVKRPHRKADPERRAPNLRDHPAIQAEAGVRTIHFFERLDGLVDVLQCAVKFLAAVFKALNKKPPASVTWLTKGWLRNFGRI